MYELRHEHTGKLVEAGDWLRDITKDMVVEEVTKEKVRIVTPICEVVELDLKKDFINGFSMTYKERFSGSMVEKLKECMNENVNPDYVSRNEALDAILRYEGIIGYTEWIKSLIEEIYQIKLED